MNLLHTLQFVLVLCAFTVAAHIILCRISGSKHFMIKGFLLGLFAFGLLLVYQLIVKRIDLVELYLFVAIWLLYVMILIHILNSVTLKMLAYLHAESHGSVASAEFSTVFNVDDGLQTRLEMMTESGLLEVHSNALNLTGKARTLLKIISIINRFFSLKTN